jgi:hypothetical protein
VTRSRTALENEDDGVPADKSSRAKPNPADERSSTVNTIARAFGLLLLVACRPGTTSVSEARADETGGGAYSGVAVVELFTSEGCSSCPPADAVLANLARAKGNGVYPLSFHVDYWDNLGWPDRFASADNSARQRAYGRAFGAGGVYTPQTIVDGTEQFTGSDAARTNAALARALERPALVALTIKARAVTSNFVTVEYSLPNVTSDALLNVAVVEHEASTRVRSGENAGRTLHHANVVRAFVSAPLGSGMEPIRVPLPASLRHEDAEIIAYVQRSASEGGGLPIIGAARCSLASP